MVIEVTDTNFEEEVIEKSKTTPVVVDFWASWCGPCQMLAPILDRIADQYKDKVAIVKMSVEENQQTPKRYQVMSIPAVKMFKNGQVIDEFTGAIPEQQVKDFIDKNLK